MLSVFPTVFLESYCNYIHCCCIECVGVDPSSRTSTWIHCAKSILSEDGKRSQEIRSNWLVFMFLCMCVCVWGGGGGG